MAGGAGRYGCDGAGDSECVKIVAQEIRQTDRNIERDRSPRSSGERVRVRKRQHRSQSSPSTAFANQITIRQSIRFFSNQFVFHKGTKPVNIACRRRIISNNQQRFASCILRTVLRTIITGSGQRRPRASKVWSGLEKRSVIFFSVAKKRR